MRTSQYKSLVAFVLCFFLLLYATVLSHRWNNNWKDGVLTYDVAGYYLYLPSIFYDDLGKLNNYKYLVDTYHPGGTELDAYPAPNGNYIMKYSCGMSAMYFPAFVAGHVWAKHSGYPRDGFSRPYRFCVMIESLFVALIGLWFIRKILLRYFEDKVVAIALVALCFATNYLNFVTFTSSLTHNYLFSVYAILLCLTDDWYRKPTYKTSIALGLLAGLAALIRPTEIICVVLPLFWLVGNMAALKERVITIRAHFSKIIVFILCAIMVGSIQLIYWKIYTGHFLYWSYSPNEGLDFLKLNIWNCLFSYKKGWFIYTPFMLIAIIGFVPLYRYRRPLFWSAFIFTLLNLWIFTAWSNWSYGGSFSQRAVVQSYSVLLFPICAFLVWVFKRRISIVLFSFFFVFCIWLNLLMTYQANVPGRFMECDEMTPQYFWAIFGKVTPDKQDRRLLEMEDETPASKIPHLYTLYQPDTGVVEVLDGGHRYLTEAVIKIYDPRQGWYKTYMDVYLTGWQFDFYKSPYIYVGIYNNDSLIRGQSYRIQDIMDGNVWQTIPIDIEAPADVKFNKFKMGLDNNRSSVPVRVKNVKVGFVAAN